MLDCRIIKLRNGEVVALNQDGTPSKLYREALAYTGDVQKALDLWQTAYTDEFQLEYKSNTDDSAVLNDVLKFLDTNNATTNPGLSEENRAELVSVMQQFGYKRLSKLYKDLHAIYKAKGVLDMDGSKAVSTGLYTINDVYELDVDSVREILSQIEKQGLIADIQLEDADPYTNIVDSSRKNILGSSERISEQEAENILKQEITDFSSKEDIENVIRNSDFSEHFSGRKREALVKKFGALKRIPEVFIAEDGTLSATDKSLYNEVANTFPGDLSFEDLKPLKADVKYFKELSDKTWNENTDKIVKVLKEVEQKAAKIGLDLVGISEKPGDKEKVIGLIDSAVKLLENPSEKGLLKSFVANKSELIPATSKGYIIELSPKYRSYNVVRVNTNLSDGEMFDRHSLLKLSDNLYHIVNTKNKSEFYENLYQKLVDKKLKGVKTKDVTNKVQTLKDLEAFVMSRSVGFEVSNKEEASLAQLIFEHDSFPVREDFSAMANIKTSEDYLKTDFVLDFYKYVVEEKLKNSSVYRNTLSAFVFSDNDISINRPIKSIEGLKYNQELKDYFSIKKDLSLNNLFKGESNIKLTADVKQFNNPNSVKEFQGTKYETKGYVIADESVDDIIKVDGVLYKRAKGNVFAKIINIDTNYYSTNIAAPFEEETVNKLNESSKIAFTKKEKPLEKVVEEAKTTTEVTPVQPTNKQITKYVSQYLKDKFGSDISIMSEADMKRELAKRALGSIETISTNDKVYGFYDENTKQIFLNESFLTSNSLIHEHWHAFKPILKDLASKGDIQAKLLLDTFKRIVDNAGLFDEAAFIERYKGAKNAAGESVRFSILGEQGAEALDRYDESVSRLGQLELARKMEEDSKDPFSIRMATGWERNTVTDKWQYEIQPNMSLRKGVINDNNVFPGTTLEDLIDYPELFKAYPNLRNVKIEAVPYDEVDFDANYRPNWNMIEVSNYLLEEDSKKLKPIILHEIQHAIQVAEGYSPTSSQDIEEYINTIQNIGLKSEYSDIQDNSEEILFETLDYFKEAYKSVEEYVYNPWSQNITNTLKFFFKNIHGVNVKTPKTIKSYSINGDRVYRMDEIARETEDSSKGIIEGLNKEIAILLERNSVSSEKDLNQQLNTEKDEERLDDLNSTKRVLNNIKNRISEVENGNFKVETVEDSPELELQDLLEAYNNQNNTSLTQDNVVNDVTSYVENNRKDGDDIYYRSQSEVEARNVEERMKLSPEDRRMFVLSSTEDVDRADQLDISNGILGDMYSKASSTFSSEVYNPRPGETQEQYVDRMREEIEANLLGENSEAYFEKIATENNLTEEAKKSFKEKLKKFVKIFSDWLARQLGFNNITPAQAAKLTTTDVLDRVTTSMLRGDFRPEELVKNKLKNAKVKASELQASKDSGLEIITPVDLQNIEECT